MRPRSSQRTRAPCDEEPAPCRPSSHARRSTSVAGGGRPGMTGRAPSATRATGTTGAAVAALEGVERAVEVNLHLAPVGLGDGRLVAGAGQVRGHGTSATTPDQLHSGGL